VTALANIGLSVFLARRYGTSGVIAATVLTYASFSVIPVAIATIRTARALRPGASLGA